MTHPGGKTGLRFWRRRREVLMHGRAEQTHNEWSDPGNDVAEIDGWEWSEIARVFQSVSALPPRKLTHETAFR